MAKLFLSYSRNDTARAERFTQWLERGSHDVWRDEDDIGGGASFSSEIEKALDECDAVLVLWSAESVQSAWVRDEAGFGRDGGKLIPLSLDGTEPPLGFRQFQAIDLSKWKGRGDPPGAKRIEHAIERIVRRSPIASPPPKLHPASGPMSRRLLFGGVVAALAALAIFGFLLWRRPAGGQGITIAVVASPNSPDRPAAINYANITAADMAGFLPVHSDRASVLSPGDAASRPHDYRIEIAAARQGKGADASVTLTDATGSDILWSKNWSVTDASQADLRAPISLAASHAALCVLEATTGVEKLQQPALGIYMNGCAGFSDPDRSDAQTEGFLVRVELAPNFVPAWANLALQRAVTAAEQAAPDGKPDSTMKARADVAIASTLKLDPRNGKAYLAETFLMWPHDNLRALDLLDKAAAFQPDDALIEATRSGELRTVGRMSDSVNAAERAVELDPFSPYVAITYIVALNANGQFDRMESEIGKVRNTWRDSKVADLQEFAYSAFSGDPRRAEALLPSLDLDARNGPVRQLIAARIKPTPENIELALNAYRSVSARSPRAGNQYLGALVSFGRTDEAFQLLSDRSFQRTLPWDMLFSRRFAAIRKDPRFIKLVADLGLVRYWRTSGRWPDFCTDEQLAYDCRVEAAKYRF